MAAATSTLPRFSDAYATPSPTATSTSAATSSSSKHGDANKGDWNAYQYYFAFVALLVIVALVVSGLIFRHKRRLARRLRASRQNALSRDLEGANVGRGWTYGDGRLRDAMTMTPWRRREEEGLNEAGEAPPPYKPGPDANDAAVLATGRPASPQSGTQEPAVPPPALDREQAGLKPPDYTEAIARPIERDPVPSGPSTPAMIDAIQAPDYTTTTTTTTSAGTGPASGTTRDPSWRD